MRICNEFFRDFLLKFERFFIYIAYNDFESYLIFFLILETKTLNTLTCSIIIYIEFLRDFLLEFEKLLIKIAYDDFESYLIPFSILETKKSPVNKLVIFHFLNHTQNLIMI